MIFIVNVFQLILLILGYFRYNLVNFIKSGLSGLDYSEEFNELTGFIGCSESVGYFRTDCTLQCLSRGSYDAHQLSIV